AQGAANSAALAVFTNCARKTASRTSYPQDCLTVPLASMPVATGKVAATDRSQHLVSWLRRDRPIVLLGLIPHFAPVTFIDADPGPELSLRRSERQHLCFRCFQIGQLILERRCGRSAAPMRPCRQSINLESFQFRRSLFAASA